MFPVQVALYSFSVFNNQQRRQNYKSSFSLSLPFLSLFFFFDKADVLHFFFLPSRFLFDKLQLAPVHDLFHFPEISLKPLEKTTRRSEFEV